MRVYGIPNCDTVKKARAWLGAHGFDYEFVDFRRTPPARSDLQRWTRAFGWERVLNRRGTTWRKLPADVQARVADEASAIEAMLAHVSAIKRPVIEADGELLLGFDEAEYRARLRKAAGPASRAGPRDA